MLQSFVRRVISYQYFSVHSIGRLRRKGRCPSLVSLCAVEIGSGARSWHRQIRDLLRHRLRLYAIQFLIAPKMRGMPHPSGSDDESQPDRRKRKTVKNTRLTSRSTMRALQLLLHAVTCKSLDKASSRFCTADSLPFKPSTTLR